MNVFCRLLMIYVVVAAGCRRASDDTVSAPEKSFSPDDPQLIEANNRGVGLMGKYQYEEAREVFQELAENHPNWIDVQVNLAIAILNRQREGDEQTAMTVLERVLEADSDHLRAHYCTGLLSLYLQSPEQALTHFQIVVNAEPDDAYAAYYVGQCHAQSQRHEKAATWFERAIEGDKYLRSAYYALAQSLRALGRDDEAQHKLDEFLKLEKNPRAKLVKFIYTLMGPKGEAVAVDTASPPKLKSLPEGPIFQDPQPLLTNGDEFNWTVADKDRPVSITACDINGDSHIDIFIANVLDEDNGLRNAVCINKGDNTIELDPDHILGMVPNVNAALWGDYDNDGLTDVYFCRNGPNMLWRQIPPPFQGGGEGVGESHANGNGVESLLDSQSTPTLTLPLKGEGILWQDVTVATGTANEQFDTVDGAIFDADHDGDLDIFCVNADGPNELLNNNLNGTFTPIAAERGIAGDGRPSRQVLPVDLDSDRDLDIIVINENPPHEVYVNDRLWEYRAADGFDALVEVPMDSILAFDTNSDGQTELYGIEQIIFASAQWTLDDNGVWHSQTSGAFSEHGRPTHVRFALMDVNGDGQIELIHDDIRGLSLRDPLTGEIQKEQVAPIDQIDGWSVATLDSHAGPALIVMPQDSEPKILTLGPARHPFAAMTFSGIEDKGQSMRSNASGIGTYFDARIDSMWVSGSTLKNHSGPGQSLQPIAIGLGGHNKIDYISIDWSDGVFQSEIDLEAGKLHEITETQRQLSSCPVLFAWNGEKYEFVTDLLGVGGMGYMVAPGEYAPPRPWERLLLPENLLQPLNGQFVLKLGEPMEEACYLDAARLVAYDIPPGWKMTIDDRMGILGPEPTGEPRFYREEILPIRAVDHRNEDVTTHISSADLLAPPVGELDHRFIGRLQQDQSLTVTFDKPIDSEMEVLLIADGWIEYPYSQTMFGAWQAGAEFRAPTIEAKGAEGEWHVVLEQFGYPAGMPRQMSVPLNDLPQGTTQLRITTNQEIYWDRIAIAYAEECEVVHRHELPLNDASLSHCGFAQRTTGDQRQPYYDYNNRSPFWDTKYQRGLYTSFGPCKELVAENDSAVAIIGPGEEVEFQFASDLPPLKDGWTRRFVLETEGWCKDMDLFTKDGDTIEPLPLHDQFESQSNSNKLHNQFNTRFESGR